MVRIGLASFLLLFATASVADVSPIKQRKAILKKFADQTRPLAAMVKNRQPFDAQLVAEALQVYATGSRKLLNLFPETSQTGEDTDVSPAIWKDKPKFDALFKKFDDDATAAAAKIVDEASFRATMPRLLNECKECHDAYRGQK